MFVKEVRNDGHWGKTALRDVIPGDFFTFENEQYIRTTGRFQATSLVTGAPKRLKLTAQVQVRDAVVRYDE